MPTPDLNLIRRKEMVLTIAVVCWLTPLVLIGVGLGNLVQTNDWVGGLFYIAGAFFAAYWVRLDTEYRGMRPFLWTLFTLIISPVAIPLYLLSRKPAPSLCSQCGAVLTSLARECPACGRNSLVARAVSAFNEAVQALSKSLAPEAAESARMTAKHMAIALALVVVFGRIIPLPTDIIRIIWVFCFAGYWVLVAWWVYLDATWRRMEPVPWAMLTLVTNVFGLVTYLVIRYPDPRSCPKCGAYLSTGLKRCPYCGSEAEPTCPRCQAPIRTDWVYCPACAAQLPILKAQEPGAAPEPSSSTPVLSISGMVTDALTGSPIPSAEVRVDSKIDTRATTTDAQGRYRLVDLAPRPYVLLASAEGYTREAKAYTPGTGTPAQVHFSLFPIAESAASGNPNADVIPGDSARDSRPSES